jgi:hypothetical protein
MILSRTCLAALLAGSLHTVAQTTNRVLALDPVGNSLTGLLAEPGVAMEEPPPAGAVSGMRPFADYAVILTRKPFGNPPPVAATAAAVDPAAVNQAQEEQKLARQIHMVAVNRTPAGNVAVGFVDKAAKPERSYFLNVGESADGYTVVSASYEDETATLAKDEVTITLKLGQGLVKEPMAGAPPATTRPGPPGTAAAAGTAGLPPVVVSPPPTLTAPGATVPRTLNSESFRQRLFRQRAAREAAEAARQKRAALDAEARAEKITQEELDKAAREINLNLIRQGMAPLSPITLTPEEDAEMVRLGVLDAR